MLEAGHPRPRQRRAAQPDPPAGRLPVPPALPDGDAALHTDLPVRLEIGDQPGHWAACWLYDEATVAAQKPGSAVGQEVIQ